MEMHERIKELRKNQLNLSQEAFGERLGVSRSVINNIERNVLARPEQKLPLIRLMCKEFNVNEEWVLNGTEPMFVHPNTFSLDQFVKEKGMDEQDLKILKLYFSINPKKRHDAIEYFLSFMADEPINEPIKRFVPKTTAGLESLFPPEKDNADRVG